MSKGVSFHQNSHVETDTSGCRLKTAAAIHLQLRALALLFNKFRLDSSYLLVMSVLFTKGAQGPVLQPWLNSSHQPLLQQQCFATWSPSKQSALGKALSRLALLQLLHICMHVFFCVA